MQSEFYKLKAKTIDGKEESMDKYTGKVVLVVNTASKCGFTPQYEELQKLYSEYKDAGLEILGFPCDQFAHQEPGTDDEIRNFCSLNFGVTFPLFSKVEVNGSDAHPVFKYLSDALPGVIGKKIKWNFTKFLINKNGTPVKRFAPKTEPTKLIDDIKKLL
ncbi:MAG: glutathione peroxidase [Spirochaetales bacterium]|nr:glutathione peroxidase [Spirochaetales bacterium]